MVLSVTPWSRNTFELWSIMASSLPCLGSAHVESSFVFGRVHGGKTSVWANGEQGIYCRDKVHRIVTVICAIYMKCFDFTFFVWQRRELATQLDLEGSFKKRQEVHIFWSLPATELFSLAWIFVIYRSLSFSVTVETTEPVFFSGKLT